MCGLDPVVDELADGVADRALLVVEQGVEVEQGERVLRRAGHGFSGVRGATDARIVSNIQKPRPPPYGPVTIGPRRSGQCGGAAQGVLVP